jgi:hypothetical protein
MVSRERRGSAYGIFTAGYGISWFAGSVVMGVLYHVSLPRADRIHTGCSDRSFPLLFVSNPLDDGGYLRAMTQTRWSRVALSRYKAARQAVGTKWQGASLGSSAISRVLSRRNSPSSASSSSLPRSAAKGRLKKAGR